MGLKRRYYEDLITKMNIALESEFYLESSWISYAILEDRLAAAIENSTGSRPSSMMGIKIGELSRLILTDAYIKKVFYGDLLDKISTWKDSRNKLMHDMASDVKPFNVLEDECKELAIEGGKLTRELLNRMQRIKQK